MARWHQRLILGVVVLALSPAVDALEVEQLDVSYQKDRYVVVFSAQLDAPADAVGAVLKYYDQYPELDPRITESRVLSRDRLSHVRLFTRMRGCLGSLMCRSMQRVEEIEEQPEELLAIAVLAESEVRFGVTRSHWTANQGGTALTYRMEIMPKFWIPALFGRRLMIKTLREGTLSLFTNVESAAQRTGPAG
jgi:hypothetical protein